MFVCAGPSCCRPLPPVMTPVNVVLRGGTTARRVSGTDVVVDAVLSWTEADTSLGWLGSLLVTSTVPVAPGASTSAAGTGMPSVVKLDVVIANWTCPLKPELCERAKYAVQVPAIGKRTSTWPKLLNPCGIEYAS